jgi:hypothetical protein
VDRRGRRRDVRRHGLAATDVRPDQRADQGLNGIELARAYSAEVVEPLLAEELPGVPLATARLGSGSEVLGLDDEMSADHDWGLRLTVLVAEYDVGQVEAVLEAGLPEQWRGHPTRFATSWDPAVRQRAEVASPLGFAQSRTGLALDREPDTVEWLSLTGQAALEVTGGAVFRDDTGELAAIRNRLTWYPDDVWIYAVVADWNRIGEELQFVGRVAERHDDAGSRVIVARLARTIMHLGFLAARRWPPYSKWLGTAFAALPGMADVGAGLHRALAAGEWHEREAGLVEALDALAGEPATEPFFDRPYRGLRPLVEPLLATITDPLLVGRAPIGTVEQWSDNVALLMDGERRIAATHALFDTDRLSSPPSR